MGDPALTFTGGRCGGREAWALLRGIMGDMLCRVFNVASVLSLVVLLGGGAGPPAEPGTRSQSFDCDPKWDAHNNRIIPAKLPTVVQDFGYSPTNVAGNGPGEVGGQVTRAAEPAYYADNIGRTTLDDPLTASGTFAVTKAAGSAGIFFGFFRAEQPGATGRPISSLGIDMDCEASGARLAVRLITGEEKSCGTFVTPFIPGHFRPTPIRSDGTRYRWTLGYDPQANNGNGRISFTIHSDANPPDELLKGDLPVRYREEALSHFPHMTRFQVDLAEGFKKQQTVFDHFGLMNGLKPGHPMTIYFDDLEYCGRARDFAQDPHWDGSRHRTSYQAVDVAGAQNFGFGNTSFAGGKPGEVGGTFWRTGGNWGYYADRVGPLTLDEPLKARGKVVMTAAGPDADMCFGWFRGNDPKHAPDKSGDFLGIHVGGPTRMGHPFLPAFCAPGNVRASLQSGPALLPGKAYDWRLLYDPLADDGAGAITATLGTESVTLRLTRLQRQRAAAAQFDHFGLFSTGPGGQMVKLYLDDLQYTAARVR